MRRAITTAGIALVLSVLLAAAASGARTGGLVGTVVKSSNRPSCTEEKPCTVAAPGTTLQFVRGSSVIAHVVSGLAGAYSINLAPGTYSVRASVSGSPRKVTPATVVVADATLVHRRFLVAPRVQIQGATGRSTQ
jgi:hypothetical protein